MAGAKPGVHVVQLKPICVAESLIKGNKFIKWDESSTIGTPVTLKVDPKGYILYWKDQNKDMDYLDISLIRDTRTGKYAKVPKEGKLRETCNLGSLDVPLEDKTVSIAYSKDPSKINMVDVDFVNFVCPNKSDAEKWCDEILKYSTNLLSHNSSALSYLEKAYIKLTHVLDVNGRIPVKNVLKMVANHRDDRKRVEKALDAVGFLAGKNDTIDPSKFSFEDFFNFYRHLVGRTEVDKVFDEVGAKKKPYLTVEQFVQFLNKEQRDPRLNEILYPYYTIKQAQEFIDVYETKHGMAAKAEAGHLSQEGFLKFLMSEDNNLVSHDLLDLSQDMTAPLSHYFTNSSHNTYLTGHQLTSKSSVELYRQVLLSGCRCIELDCWDGRSADEEPIITHGYTMCTDISFKEVIEAIAESAFKTSPYPVILSFENHCNPRQQAKMANHCRNIFGDMLLTEPLASNPLEPDMPLPSPESLKYKIIVKNKKKHFHKGRPVDGPGPARVPAKARTEKPDVNGETRGGGGETEGGAEVKKRHESDSLETGVGGEEPPADYEEASDSDSDFEEEEDEEGLSDVIVRKQQIMKDKGTAGTEAEAALEMSALVNYVQPVHFHSFDVSEKRKRSYEISSFVETQATSLLKEYPVEFVNYNKRQLSRIYPKGTRVDSSNFLPQIFWNAGCQLVALNFQTLDLAMQLNLGFFEYNSRSGYILKPDFMRRDDRRFDPFAESTVDGIVANTVTVKVISGSLLSEKKIGTYVEVDMYGLPTDTYRKKFKTHIVPNNGINPVYDEAPFVFKKVVLPNLAVIRLTAYDENNKMLGHRVLQVEGLRPGYRHIPLRNECNLPLLLPTLFVYISVKDYVPNDMAMFAEALGNPIAYQSQLEKHAHQLEALIDDEEENEESTSMDKTNSPANPKPTPPRNGSITNIPTEENVVKPKTPAHPEASKKESVDSESSIDSTSVNPRPLVGVPSLNPSENGVSIVNNTKLNDPELLRPNTLEDLKKQKPYLKVVAKRDKELETLKKKHEKARENMKEIHELQEERLLITQVKAKTSLEKTHSKSLKKAQKTGCKDEVDKSNTHDYQRLIREHDDKAKSKHKELRGSQADVFIAMCKDQFNAELNICLRHHEPIYNALKEVLDQDHKNHLKQLEDIHNTEAEAINKQMEARRKVEVKGLAKNYKDKQELSRRRREAQTKHIQNVVDQRSKLKNVLAKKTEELEGLLENIRQEFEAERQRVPEQLKESFEEKCRKLTEQFKDSGLSKSPENLDKEEENTAL